MSYSLYYILIVLRASVLPGSSYILRYVGKTSPFWPLTFLLGSLLIISNITF